MAPGPPGLTTSRTVQSNEQSPPRWRGDARRLDIEDHEIYVFVEPEVSGDIQNPYLNPAIFGDLNPDPEGPDPDVWPLDLDVGPPTPVDELVRITNSFPEPNVAWVTEEHLEAQYGYNPREVEVEAEVLAPWNTPDNELSKTVMVSGGSGSLSLTEDKKRALRHVTRLWNGEVVRGNHLLLDKCPRWEDIFAGLDQVEIADLYDDPDYDDEVIEEFRGHDWFKKDASVFLEPKYVLRRKVWYAPTLKAKTLINSRDDLPSMRGDPREGLQHRVSVGLAALHYAAADYDVETYLPVGDYVVDVVAKFEDNDPAFIEVMTGHNNWELHRETYRKLSDLRSHGMPVVVFDSRASAYEIINHWIRSGLAELPSGTFDSEPRLDWAREHTQDAFKNNDIDWDIREWATTDLAWRATLGPNGLDLNPEFVTSLDW